MRTSAHVSPHSSDIRAPVSAATVNRVRYGSVDAAIVCSMCSGVKIGNRFASDTFGRSNGSMSGGRIHATEAESAGSELVDAPGRAEHGGDRRLAPAQLAHVVDQRCQLVRGDALEPALPVARAEVSFDGRPIAGLRRGAEVTHRAREPRVGCLADPKS